MTNLLVDATSLGTDSAYRGIGTYLRHLLAGLGKDERLSVTALVRSETELPAGVAGLVPVDRRYPPRQSLRLRASCR